VVKRVLKRAFEIVEHAPDRALHPLRRQRAAQELRGHVPKNVVFVCHGNICRSPFAAAYFQRLAASTLKHRIATSSVGFIGPGRGAPPAALAAASRRDLDLSRHRSRLVSAKVLRAADLVVVMSAEQARTIRRLSKRRVHVLVLGDLDPESISSRTVIDPWGGSDAVFDASYDRIERCVRELVRLVGEGSGPLHPEPEPITRASNAGSGGRAARGTSRRGLPR
jgi:protein-tyrosine phosphatase